MNPIIDLRDKIIIHPKKGKIIQLELLGYVKVKTLINDDLLLIPIGANPSIMIIKKDKYII